MTTKNFAIIVASGKNIRMQVEKNKNLLELNGKEIIAYTLQAFEDCQGIHEIVLTVREGEENIFWALCKKYNFNKVKKIVWSGKERQDSVWNGIIAVKELNPSLDDFIAIHDGARALITPEMIENALNAAKDTGASVLGVPSKDTIKIVDNNQIVISTPDRKTLWNIQTPQVIKFLLMIRAFEKAYSEGFYGTDDVGLVERLNEKVQVMMGSYENIKITTPEDVKIAEKILEYRIAYNEKNANK